MPPLQFPAKQDLRPRRQPSTWRFVDAHLFDVNAQCGSNENTNGLLRQYFPNGTEHSGYSYEYLNKFALRINQRPRKILGFKRLPINCLQCWNDRLNPPLKADGGEGPLSKRNRGSTFRKAAVGKLS